MVMGVGSSFTFRAGSLSLFFFFFFLSFFLLLFFLLLFIVVCVAVAVFFLEGLFYLDSLEKVGLSVTMYIMCT